MKVYIYTETSFDEKRKATEDFEGLKVDEERWQEVGGGHIAFPVILKARCPQCADNFGEPDDVIVLTTRKTGRRVKVKSCHVKDGKPMVLVTSGSGSMQSVWVGERELFTDWGSEYDHDEGDWVINPDFSSYIVDDYGSMRAWIGHYCGELKVREELWKAAGKAVAPRAAAPGVKRVRKRVRAKDALTAVAEGAREAKKAAE